MARVTIEDCLKIMDNAFDICALAGKRAKDLSAGAEPKIDCKDKPTVIALREIAQEKIGMDYFEISNKQKIEISYQSLIILMIGIVSSIAMVVSPSYHSGTNLFFYICLLIFTFSNIDFSLFSKKLIYINIIFSIVLLFFGNQSK